MRHLAIPLIARRASGLYIRVVESDGVLERARWVGPFADAEAIVDWLELCASKTAPRNCCPLWTSDYRWN
jgi:hypothetical protein